MKALFIYKSEWGPFRKADFLGILTLIGGTARDSTRFSSLFDMMFLDDFDNRDIVIPVRKANLSL